jgi:hypothetical protein
MKALFGPFIGRVLVLVRSVGPYAAIELLLPGGSVVALFYWWYRHRVSAGHTRDIRECTETHGRYESARDDADVAFVGSICRSAEFSLWLSDAERA